MGLKYMSGGSLGSVRRGLWEWGMEKKLMRIAK